VDAALGRWRDLGHQGRGRAECRLAARAALSERELTQRVPLTPTAVEILKRRSQAKGWVSFHFRADDLRRTAASYMGEAGVDRFHIAHVLNHRSVTHNTVTAIYDRYRYDK